MGIPSISAYNMPGTKELPENKVAWKAEASRSVLLIHDMQKYFLKAYDNQASPIVELIENIKKLKKQCEDLGIPVVYTAQPGDQAPEDRALLQDFWGSGLKDEPSHTNIIDELTPSENDPVLTKWRYSAFQRTELLEQLQSQGRDQLIICGVYAHIGCLLTACEAFMQDIQAFFVGDAVADFSYDEHVLAMKYTSSRCGYTTLTNQIISELKEDQLLSESYDSNMEVTKKRVADLLEVPVSSISNTENLLDLGLDSIRIMSLVEDWRQEGIEVDFMELSENPTVQNWHNLVTSSRQYV